MAKTSICYLFNMYRVCVYAAVLLQEIRNKAINGS